VGLALAIQDFTHAGGGIEGADFGGTHRKILLEWLGLLPEIANSRSKAAV
jgi:hypothetical protein